MQSETLKHVRVGRRLLMSTCAWLRYTHPCAFSTWRILHQNHYEVLGLEKTCSPVEIREQFIRLSKECHPDTNPASECHKEFVAINEAYSVLSKPGLRRAYDAELQARRVSPEMHTYGDIKTNAPMGNVVFHDDSLWEHRDKTEFYKNKDRPYYGVKGVKKLPNSYIAAGAVIFMVVGASFYFYIAKTSSDYAIEQLNIRDRLASQHHSAVRQKAMANGNEVQMALLRQRIEEADHNK
ncbi:hypothetical protein O3P69_005644 [Scylla paramamosain]|uniref:J domain-containing protein n=1 Tax=Scylla paramamosain TaxID=85552 RepID=A0AAW0U6H0_SCYPA